MTTPPGGGAPAAISTTGLRKTYRSRGGPVEAVRGIDLTIHNGEFFGLLGPNGAGKSTTIGMLTTIVVPSGGSAQVVGIDVRRHPVAVKRRIGMVSQNNSLDRRLNVAENIEFRGRYFGMSARQARQRADELLEMFALDEKRKALAHELSGGQAKRVMICRALVHRPEVLFLDEPTSGIDPQTRVNLWATLRSLHELGQTILLTTHYMEEAEELCERVAIVDHGEILACDTVEALKSEQGADTVLTVRYDGTAPPLNGLAERHGVSRVEVDGEQIRIFARSPDGVLGDLVNAGSAAGRTVRDVATLRPSLESVYLNLTGREYRE
ncbi:MAG: ATP-binding cassette domain-containing protein [Actinocatenispora sp.]